MLEIACTYQCKLGESKTFFFVRSSTAKCTTQCKLSSCKTIAGLVVKSLLCTMQCKLNCCKTVIGCLIASHLCTKQCKLGRCKTDVYITPNEGVLYGVIIGKSVSSKLYSMSFYLVIDGYYSVVKERTLVEKIYQGLLFSVEKVWFASS